MPYFAKNSRKNMQGIHPFLKRILNFAIEFIDFSVVSGVRTLEEQEALYAKGRSEPGDIITNCDGIEKRSNHQINTETGYGHAVDIYPYPAPDLEGTSGLEREKELRRFVALFYFIRGCWEVFKLLKQVRGDLRWGGDWDSDLDFNDQSFDDLPHIELILNEDA